jgi:hypothetical protein
VNAGVGGAAIVILTVLPVATAKHQIWSQEGWIRAWNSHICMVLMRGGDGFADHCVLRSRL